MCMGGAPSPPPPAKLPEPPPSPAPPEATAVAPVVESKLGTKESGQRRAKAMGTRSLRIPLGGTEEEATGLNIPA